MDCNALPIRHLLGRRRPAMVNSTFLYTVQWAQKVYSVAAEKEATSTYYILGCRCVEDHCFQHLSQHVQGFSVIQYQVLKTSGFFNFNKKFCHATMVEFKQLLKGLSSEI
jgi:hypothetical protein